MLVTIAHCHTIVVDEKSGAYNSSSPDEIALVEGVRKLGIEFENRDSEGVYKIKNHWNG